MIGVPRGSTNPRRKEWVWRRMDHALFRLGNMWLGLSPIQLLMILVFPCSGLAPFELIPTWNATFTKHLPKMAGIETFVSVFDFPLSHFKT